MANNNDIMTEIRQKIKDFPASPGVYLMKDAEGRVLYIGKAKNLRDRASSYFQPSADLMNSRGPKIVELINKVEDIGFLPSETEVDAILNEARLIKDIQPPYNTRQLDDKTFPYLEITKEEYPGVYVTRSPAKDSRLHGPFTSASDLRRVLQILQRIFRFRTCTMEISSTDEKRRFFRPCILADIKQCWAPCADRISKKDYRNHMRRFDRFLKTDRSTTIKQLEKEMAKHAKEMNYEEAARLRDEIKAIHSLQDRGQVDEHVQPELFQVDVATSLERLTDLLNLDSPVRVIEGVDIAHLMGNEMVGSLVCFIDGRPFKKRYRRFKIKQVEGINDYASIQEVLGRRYRKAGEHEELYPDVILIDGGLGQLHAAQDLFKLMDVQPPMVISLAKKEELIHTLFTDEPIKLPRNDPALRLLQYVRDESHRFAQHYYNILRQRKTFE